MGRTLCSSQQQPCTRCAPCEATAGAGPQPEPAVPEVLQRRGSMGGDEGDRAWASLPRDMENPQLKSSS